MPKLQQFFFLIFIATTKCYTSSKNIKELGFRSSLQNLKLTPYKQTNSVHSTVQQGVFYNVLLVSKQNV